MIDKSLSAQYFTVVSVHILQILSCNDRYLKNALWQQYDCLCNLLGVSTAVEILTRSLQMSSENLAASSKSEARSFS